MVGFTPWSLALRGLVGWRAAHAAVAAGVAVATAVLVGALVVGDSVRGSLRDLTLERLGEIDFAITPGRPFREALAQEVAASSPGARVAPLLLATASATHRAEGGARHTSGLTLIGCDARFAALASKASFTPPAKGAVLTRSVAQELGVGVGDSILIRTERASTLPADSALGEKDDTVASRRVVVERIAEGRGLYRFGLTPTQGEPRSLFLPLSLAQDLTDLTAQATVLVASGDAAPRVQPQLADLGLLLDEVRPGVWQLESRELVLPDTVVDAAMRAWRRRTTQRATTYLANTIRLGDRSIPYSTVSGVEAVGGRNSLSPTTDDAITLTRWAADDLGAEVGEDVRLTYYEPESTHGELREAPPVSLRVERIVDLVDGAGRPTEASDRRWTPRLEGVTDAESINSWDLPFELVETIRDNDEAYWDDYGTTPKAYVTRRLAERLWGSRWGSTSLIRIDASDTDGDALGAELLAALDPAVHGFLPWPIREEGVAASRGSTPFDVLFVMFSLFLIVSALLLIALLVALALDARRREAGLLGAIGFGSAALRGVWLRELALVAAVGALAGVALGVAYAAGLLHLLRTIWIDAIRAPFVTLHANPTTIATAGLAAWLISLAAIAGAAHRAAKVPPRTLLAGAHGESRSPRRTTRRAQGVALAGATLTGLALMRGGAAQGEAAAAAFFVAGGMTLVTVLAVMSLYRSSRAGAGGGMSLGGLALSNILRRRSRSLLVIGLTAAACFLVLATSAFRLPPTDAGTGGFSVVAQSDLPLLHNPATPAGREALGVPMSAEGALAATTIHSFRVQPGEDASCGNLYQARQPRVLGVPKSFVEAASSSPTPFEWAATRDFAAPWDALSRPDPSAPEATPVAIDFNTAVYSLKLYGGVGSRLTFLDGSGRPREAIVVGLLKNSVLQGDLLMSEDRFLGHFPQAAGYRFFMAAAEDRSRSIAALEESLRDYGLDAVDAAERLAGYLSVQNTYLSTFQALGGLGLAFGTVGLAVAQFRNLLERRGELALLRAAGFSTRRLGRLVVTENLLLLGAGLGVGGLAATVALAPLGGTGDLRPPWQAATALLLLAVAVGLGSAWWSLRGQLGRPLHEALRAE